MITSTETVRTVIDWEPGTATSTFTQFLGSVWQPVRLKWTGPTARFKAQELCEGRGGRPGLTVPNSLHGLCERKATLNSQQVLANWGGG